MAKYIVTVYLLFLGINSYTQSNWVQKEVGNNIYIKFPKNPVYKLTEKARTYTAITENNIFMVLVQNAGIPNYGDFENQPEEQKNALINMLLENYIIGFLKATGNENRTSTDIQIGDYRGKEISFSSISPSTGNRTMNYCKFMFALNKVYTFQCKNLKDEVYSQKEKDIFLNSVTTMLNLNSQEDSVIKLGRDETGSSTGDLGNDKLDDQELIERLRAIPPEEALAPAKILEGTTDPSGLGTGIGVADVGFIPEKYEEMNRELNLNLSPFNLPSQSDLDKMLKDYERGKLIKKIVGGIAILLTGIILTREYFRRRKQNKTVITKEEKLA